MRSPFCRISRSFTLIEVTLGLAILVLIFGVIFQLVQMAVLGAEAAGKNSQRSREITGLFALLRQLCLDLPVRSQLSLEPRSPGPGHDLLLVGAPSGILPEQYGGVRSLRFAVQKDPVDGNNLLVLQEIFRSANEMERPGSPQTNTFELMRDVISVAWWVGDTRKPAQMEQDQWNEVVKPAYLKLILVRRQAGQEVTNTGIFWIPTGYGPSGTPPVDPVTRGSILATSPPATP